MLLRTALQAPCRGACSRAPTSCCCAAKRSTASRAAWCSTAPSARSSSSASFTSAVLCCRPASRCVCSACRENLVSVGPAGVRQSHEQRSAVALHPGGLSQFMWFTAGPGSTYTRGAICESLIHSRTWVTHCWPPDEAMACRPAGCACRQPEGPNSGPRQAVFTDKADGHHAWKDAAALRQAAFARTLAALHTHRQPDGSRDHVRRQGTDDQYTFRTRSQST